MRENLTCTHCRRPMDEHALTPGVGGVVTAGTFTSPNDFVVCAEVSHDAEIAALRAEVGRATQATNDALDLCGGYVEEVAALRAERDRLREIAGRTASTADLTLEQLWEADHKALEAMGCDLDAVEAERDRLRAARRRTAGRLWELRRQIDEWWNAALEREEAERAAHRAAAAELHEASEEIQRHQSGESYALGQERGAAACAQLLETERAAHRATREALLLVNVIATAAIHNTQSDPFEALGRIRNLVREAAAPATAAPPLAGEESDCGACSHREDVHWQDGWVGCLVSKCECGGFDPRATAAGGDGGES